MKKSIILTISLMFYNLTGLASNDIKNLNFCSDQIEINYNSYFFGKPCKVLVWATNSEGKKNGKLAKAAI